MIQEDFFQIGKFFESGFFYIKVYLKTKGDSGSTKYFESKNRKDQSIYKQLNNQMV